jgi:prepilin-type N-terminal cleavage/methylation domain-containing protein
VLPPLPAIRPPSDARPGVTLLELLVVLVLLGLVAALTAPAALRAPTDAALSEETRVVSMTRAAAVRRGETLALDVRADGVWTMKVARGDSLPLGEGRIAAPRPPVRLLVTPLGVCLPDGDDADAAPWDATACRPVASR